MLTTLRKSIKSGLLFILAAKYNPNTKNYTTLSDGAKQMATIGGQSAVAATYSVTDGSDRDTDGTLNGTIVDPVGLALVSSESTGATGAGNLANTGQNTTFILSAAIMLVSASAVIFIKKPMVQGKKIGQIILGIGQMHNAYNLRKSSHRLARMT